MAGKYNSENMIRKIRTGKFGPEKQDSENAIGKVRSEKIWSERRDKNRPQTEKIFSACGRFAAKNMIKTSEIFRYCRVSSPNFSTLAA